MGLPVVRLLGLVVAELPELPHPAMTGADNAIAAVIATHLIRG